jgi:uncharacterized membrane protein
VFPVCLTPEQRSLRASIFGFTRWARENPEANTARAHAGPLEGFRGEVLAADPPANEPNLNRRAERGMEERRRPDTARRDEDIQQSRPGALDALQYQIERKWEGLMPSPSTLAQYDMVKPGLAERITAMAETVAAGDIKIRAKIADAEIERARTGQATAALITAIALGAAIYFFAVDNPVAGGVMLSVPVIMLVRAFLGRS